METVLGNVCWEEIASVYANDIQTACRRFAFLPAAVSGTDNFVFNMLQAIYMHSEACLVFYNKVRTKNKKSNKNL